MRFSDVVRVLDALDAKGVDAWVGGGTRGTSTGTRTSTTWHNSLELSPPTTVTARTTPAWDSQPLRTRTGADLLLVEGRLILHD